MIVVNLDKNKNKTISFYSKHKKGDKKEDTRYVLINGLPGTTKCNRDFVKVWKLLFSIFFISVITFFVATNQNRK